MRKTYSPLVNLENLRMPADARPNLTAADVMTVNPRTCSTFSTVLEAGHIFRDADCSAVPVLLAGQGGRRALVVDRQGFPLGIVALSELARHAPDARLIQAAAATPTASG
jgi:CBS domain-containing protein